MITKNYIKMCEKALEIQNLCKKVTGDYIYFEGSKEINIIGIDEFCWLENFGSGKPAKEWVKSYWEGDRPRYYGNKGIWLPTQEQLQEMIKDIWANPSILLAEFYGWQVFIYPKFKDESITERWFAFVMYEKYNKIWNGENWIKI